MNEQVNDQIKQDAPTEPPVTLAGQRPALIALFIAVTLVSLTIDLGMKYYAFHFVADAPVVLDHEDPPWFGVPHHEPRVIVPGVLNLQLTANEGAIFGIGKGSRWVFVVVSVLAVAFVLRVFWRSDARMRMFHIALALILAGALGNLYDRIFYALVRDMLHLFPNTDLPWGLTWPGGARGLYPWVFNPADVSLLAGVISVVWVTWRYTPRSSASEKAPG